MACPVCLEFFLLPPGPRAGQVLPARLSISKAWSSHPKGDRQVSSQVGSWPVQSQLCVLPCLADLEDWALAWLAPHGPHLRVHMVSSRRPVTFKASRTGVTPWVSAQQSLAGVTSRLLLPSARGGSGHIPSPAGPACLLGTQTGRRPSSPLPIPPPWSARGSHHVQVVARKHLGHLFRKAHEAFAPLLGFMLRLRRCWSVSQPPLSALEGTELRTQAEEALPALLARVGLERKAPSPVLTWSPTGFSLLAHPGRHHPEESLAPRLWA